jgi:adenosylcobinamide kinase/adenosylcobinamide-phosphate guanylyltransferase
VVLLDCLTLWLSNLLLRGESEAAIAAKVAALADALRDAPFAAIVVTNEVGMGIVPESPLGRSFRDVAGRAHQAFAARADRVYFAMLGTMLRLVPGPVALEPTPHQGEHP